MPNVKSPGNDGLTKEFFGIFWSEVKKKHFYHVFSTLLVKKNSVPHKDKEKQLNPCKIFSILIFNELYFFA